MLCVNIHIHSLKMVSSTVERISSIVSIKMREVDNHDSRLAYKVVVFALF